MEISKIKIGGCEVNVLFVGKRYIFHSEWYGVIGYADRKGYDGGNEHTFTIYAGTENTVGGSVNRTSIITAMKRYITKCESFYNIKKTIFEDSGEICNYRIEVQLIEQTK